METDWYCSDFWIYKGHSVDIGNETAGRLANNGRALCQQNPAHPKEMPLGNSQSRLRNRLPPLDSEEIGDVCKESNSETTRKKRKETSDKLKREEEVII